MCLFAALVSVPGVNCRTKINSFRHKNSRILFVTPLVAAVVEMICMAVHSQPALFAGFYCRLPDILNGLLTVVIYEDSVGIAVLDIFGNEFMQRRTIDIQQLLVISLVETVF